DPRSPPSAEVPYCELPRHLPASEDPLGAPTSCCQSVVGLGFSPGPERGLLAELPAEGSRATSRSSSREPEAVPYLEGLASPPCGSFDQGPDSGPSSSPDCDTPDDTSSSSSTRVEPLDTGSGSRNAGQHWAKLRGESGYFSLERHQSALSQASSATPQSGPRSATHQAPSRHRSAQKDVGQTASTPDTPKASSSRRITQQVTPRTSSAQQDIPRTSSMQQNTPRASSPARIAQWDNPRTLSTQRNNPQISSPPRASQQNSPRTSSTQQDNPHTSFPTCAPQRDTPRASSPNRTSQRDTPRASSPNRTSQRDTPRTFSPNRTSQRDTPKASSPNRTSQRDTPRASSPNRTSQRDTPRTFSPNRTSQQDTPRVSSPNRTSQRDNPRTFSPNRTSQRDTPRASSPNRTSQRDNPRTFSPNRTSQRDNPRTFSPNRTSQRDTPRASSPNRTSQRDNPRTFSPNRTSQRDNPRTHIQQNTSRASSTQQNNPKTSCTQRDNLLPSSFRQDNLGASSPQSCTQQDNPGRSSPHRSTQWNNPRNSPHRTNKDIPWASFPLRPTQSEGPRTSSPFRSKQSEIPWASIALRPTQSDRHQTSAPTKAAQRDLLLFSGPMQHNSPSRATSSSHNPGHHSASRTSLPLYPAPCRSSQSSFEPSQPPWAVCIGHRDAPRASSPPRSLQHDPFPFFPDSHASEGELPHHNPPYMPPAVCIGHRDAPRASSPPRHTQFDPFPFLPDTSDPENQSPQHDLPQFPQPVCIGYRDAPRASSPPRQAPEPSFLFQDLPRASTESLVPSTDSLHEPPHFPTPVCIGHRDAPSFSSPPRQAPEPSLFFQDPPGTSMESLAPSTDSLHGSPVLPPQVCIGHRDAPRASSPPRHPHSDLALLASSPPPGSTGGSRGSAPPGETRHNLEREEYTMLADLPPPRRLAQREPGPQGSNGGRTRSPGRAEVTKLLVKQTEPAQRSGAEPSHPRSPKRQPEGDRQLQRPSLPSRTSPRTPEKEQQTERLLESGRVGPRQPLRGWQSQEEIPGSRGPAKPLERGWRSQEEGPGLGGWQELGEPSQGAARAWEETWKGPPRESEENWGQPGGPTCHRGQSEAWEGPLRNGRLEPLDRPAQRGWGSLQELSSPHQPMSSPENSRVGPAEFSKSWRSETFTPTGWGAEGACPHLQGTERLPELDWKDLLGLLGAPREGAWAPRQEPTLDSRLPRLDWEGLLELLQAQLPHKDPAGQWGGLGTASGAELGFPGTKDALEQKQHSQPEGWEETTLVNGHSPRQWSQSSAQPSSPACISTQWPKTRVTSRAETSATAGMEDTGQLGSRSPAEGPGLPEWEFQSEEPEVSEPTRGQDSLSDQKQADSVVGSWEWVDKRLAAGKAGSLLKGRLVTSWRMPGDRPTLFNPFLLSLGVLRWQRPDLLNFKKGWMSILDEPGEWKKHWFVLTDSSLKYYRDSTAEEADELDGEIDLRSCTDVTEYAVQRNYGFQIHTKDAVYTLSAMTSGIRRNWIEALRKTVRPTSAPDVTKYENALHSYGTQRGSLKAGEPRVGSEVIGRGSPRKVDGQRQSLDYVELSPLTQGSPQRARTPARTLDRPAKQEELERDLAQRSEERRKWFEATDSRAKETPAGEGPRRGLGAPLTEDQQSRLSEEIEKKWRELEKLPLRENKRAPLTALLNQSREANQGSPSDSHEALEKEEACERSLAEMESSHQQVMEELQRHHERELQRLQQEKEWLLAEETAATASAIEAMKKAYQEELSRELSKTRSLQQGPDGLRKQHQSDVEALKRELQVLSEQYSQKCLEIGALTRQAEEREHTLRRCQQEGQELVRHNQELHARLSEEIDRLRGFIASQGTGNGCGRSSERSSCELEVLLRVKENELQYLKKEVQCLRDELQMLQKDKRFTSGKYQDVYVELNHIKTRSEREIEQLKEHLRLAMAALQEREAVRSSLAE
ncbi:hypothetical protein MC885_003156, partial [Smutsia gigantea]